MTLLSLSIKHLQIPFKMAFNHASAQRTMTDSVLITAKTELNIGYGESCPRTYVTQETYSSVLKFFQKHQASIIGSIHSLATLKNWMKKNKEDIDTNPAAWCAIELALLDLLARENDATLEKFLQLPELSGSYHYSAVLGESNFNSFTKLLFQYKSVGFHDYKIKLSGDLAHDKAKSDLIVKEIKDVRLRLDANNLWMNPQEAIDYITKLGHTFFAIEEPLQTFDFKGLSSIFNELGIKIILDESFINHNQFKYIKDNPKMWIINIRISKMGGLLRSLDIIKEAKKHHIPCIIGAQVGETSILTRAALTIVNAYRDVIIAQEGACGTHLLEDDICSPILMFYKNGLLPPIQISSLDQKGLGLTIKEL